MSDIRINTELELLDEIYSKECMEFEQELPPELVEKFYRLENLKEKLILLEVKESKTNSC